ncbi:double-stranded RNA binding motif domain-containing protein [Variovorax ginsengisoli]|uniref:Double-stranded RNA binding motif domain-containing protein n=1 Tax=Variovorax ginsengisoli TaxID=363844 RepID=A0ABT8SAW9_9BURK|nr:double-stranded RNA binding motif domain-containing protein [Variovorax ginsengisoli]MDN8616408.1 double-stranded RNA binding motif domain-containing protein [Variovorax ginsengisoli]MDO1535578.1 double-stranded RNA binding motif domain-containing protein [Variovorax ginsengisoli]
MLEHCQKNKLGTPTFTSTSTGPSNAPTFLCQVELTAAGGRVHARSAEASTKRQAEALAAQALLDQLGARRDAVDQVDGTAATAPLAQSSTAGPTPVASDRGRTIQLLLEYAQKARLSAPTFEFVELSKTPSSFECRACLALAEGPIELRATDASKQGSKAAAAALVLEHLATNLVA